MAKILILDDSELILDMLEMVCVQAGHQVVKCIDFTALEESVSRETPDVVLSDLNMPDMPTESDPVASLQTYPALVGVPVIIVSGRPQAELDAIATSIGAAGAISKDAGMMGMATVLPGLLESL